MLAAETLTQPRLQALRALGGTPVLAITARRAATLKARPYDGDLARLRLPDDVGPDWVRSVAEPADDLAKPLLGPFVALREGDASAHRAALWLTKTARLLPAALALNIDDPDAFAAAQGLTRVTLAEATSAIEAATDIAEVVAARVPLAVSQSAACMYSAPAMVAKSITPSRSAARRAPRPFWQGCIRPASPAT